MKRMTATAIAAAVFLGVGGANRAQAQLTGSDRALLYYYSFYTNQKTEKMLRSQQQVIKDLQRVERTENRILSRPADPIEQYIRQGRVTPAQQIPLPPIYSGRRQYFQRFDSFNPQQRQ